MNLNCEPRTANRTSHLERRTSNRTPNTNPEPGTWNTIGKIHCVLLPLLATLAVGWLTVLVAAPVMPVRIAAPVYLFASFVCHQIEERSFHVGGQPLPVCARCLGIYAGAAAVAGLGCLAGFRRPLARWPAARFRRIAVVAALPTAVTVVAEWLGVWATSNSQRASAGLLLGAAAALVVVGAVATLHYDGCPPRRRPHIPPSEPV